MPHAVSRTASLRPLDYRQTADALQEALELRRPGLAAAAMQQTMTGVVAELLADALLGAGYVVALPIHTATTRLGLTAETLTQA